MAKKRMKIVEIVKDETVETIRIHRPKLVCKLATLIKKMEACRLGGLKTRESIKYACFAVFGWLGEDVRIWATQGDNDMISYELTFDYEGEEGYQIYINFAKRI